MKIIKRLKAKRLKAILIICLMIFGVLLSKVTAEEYTLSPVVQSKSDFGQNKNTTIGESLSGMVKTVIAYDKEYFYGPDERHRSIQQTVNFPDANQFYGNVIMHLQLDCPKGKCDAWDRAGYVEIVEPKGERVEIMRFMTPYGVGGKWSVDVTPLQSLLKGSVKMNVFIDTWVHDGHDQGNGWLATVSFDFKDPLSRPYPVLAIPLWNDQGLKVGDDTKPTDKKTSRKIPIPMDAVDVKLRSLITGHGQYVQSDTTKNCAEFCPKKHTFTVGGKKYSRTVWRDDCGQNSLGSAQRGNWQLPRAGWCPGDIVRPWLENVTGAVQPGSSIQIEYEVENYNNNPDKIPFDDANHTQPFYRTSSILLITRNEAGQASSPPIPSRASVSSGLQDVVGCDDKGHIKTVRQIRFSEKVYCVLGENSILKDGRLTNIYELQGTAEQTLVIKLIGGMMMNRQFHPSFVLVGSDSQVVAAEKNNSRQRIVQAQVKLPATGIYTILISDVDAKAGGYSLVIEREPKR